MRRRITTIRRRGFSRDPSAPFRVSKTYETWDEEALEAGDTDDKGYEYEDEPMTLREVLHELERGTYHGSDSPYRWRPGMKLLRFYSTDDDVNYRSGERTSYALHVRGSERAIRRLYETIREHRPSMLRDSSRRRARGRYRKR